MLVVIAIIGIVAALVVNMNVLAKAKQREAQVNGDKANLTRAIEDYQSRLNFYPPDNANLANTSAANYAANYDGWAATNPLVYELTGAINTNGNILLFDGTTTNQTGFGNLFGRPAVANSNPDDPHQFYTPQPKEYTNYPGSLLKGLLVPVTGNVTPNFWHYDASSPNRHNLASYDLWAEYISATKNGLNIITTNGNWQP